MLKNLIKKNNFFLNSFFRYFFLRFISIFFTLFLVIFFNVLILKIIPGDEFDRISYISESQNYNNFSINKSESNEIKSLNKVSQFIDLFFKYLSFDFGKSNFENEVLSKIILKKLLNSILISLIAIVLIFFISSYLARLKILYNDSTINEIITIILTILNSIPSFIFSLIIIRLIFKFNFNLGSESTDFGIGIKKIIITIKKFFFPVLILVSTRLIKPTLIIERFIKKEMNEEYFENLIAFGISKKKIIMNAFRKNIFIQCIMLFSSTFNSIFSSLLIIETLFSLDGIGILFFDGILNRDYPMILGIIFILSVTKILINFFEDLIISIADPRIKFHNKIS